MHQSPNVKLEDRQAYWWNRSMLRFNYSHQTVISVFETRAVQSFSGIPLQTLVQATHQVAQDMRGFWCSKHEGKPTAYIKFVSTEYKKAPHRFLTG